MGCGAVETSNEQRDEKEDDKKLSELYSDKNSYSDNEDNKTSSTHKKTYNFDENTINYFKHFTEEEINLILERKKSLKSTDNFIFLYSKFEVDYIDKNLSKNNTVSCTEYLVCYVDPQYTGNFGYESQVIGFCPKDVKLDHCSIKGKNVFAQMKNNGKIITILQIAEENKDETYKDIMIFEFIYHLTQIKMYGMRVIDIFYDQKPMTCSISIKYDKNIFSINSSDDSAEDKNNFHLFNKKKFCLTLIDKNNVINIKKDDSKISNLLHSKFTSDEIKQINNSLKSMNIKPLQRNLIYEKMIHNLENNKDTVKGCFLIFQPSFEKTFFDMCEGIDTTPDCVDFVIKELKVNDELLINIKNLEEKESRPENYYESCNTSHHYNISSNDDFILFEFELEGIEIQKNKNEVEYNLDAKKIFNMFLEYGTFYKFEIELNGHNVYFNNEDTYKYKCNKSNKKITFEGVWQLKEWKNKESKKILPNEFVIKK